MKEINMERWKKYGFEFLSIFIAVISAFALNNWSENRRDKNSENKILIEIRNGLEKDLEDIRLNILGHKDGILACNYFRKALRGEKIKSDSLMLQYFNLTRDFISIQNTAGYETLKSKGLELIKNDSLRLQVISIYEYDYNILRKLEEEYAEMQFHRNYFKEINEIVAPNFTLDSNQTIIGIQLPLKIQEHEKKEILLYLWKIQVNRVFILQYYSDIEEKVSKLREKINMEIKR